MYFNQDFGRKPYGLRFGRNPFSCLQYLKDCPKRNYIQTRQCEVTLSLLVYSMHCNISYLIQLSFHIWSIVKQNRMGLKPYPLMTYDARDAISNNYRIIPNRSTGCLDKSPGGGCIRFREPDATVTNMICKRNRP